MTSLLPTLLACIGYNKQYIEMSQSQSEILEAPSLHTTKSENIVCVTDEYVYGDYGQTFVITRYSLPHLISGTCPSGSTGFQPREAVPFMGSQE